MNSVIGEYYKMYTKTDIEFRALELFNKKIPQIKMEVPVERNIILHKSCGNEFWMERNALASNIKKGLPLCPCCKVKILKDKKLLMK